VKNKVAHMANGAETERETTSDLSKPHWLLIWLPASIFVLGSLWRSV